VGGFVEHLLERHEGDGRHEFEERFIPSRTGAITLAWSSGEPNPTTMSACPFLKRCSSGTKGSGGALKPIAIADVALSGSEST
jgi:hypothetical protein